MPCRDYGKVVVQVVGGMTVVELDGQAVEISNNVALKLLMSQSQREKLADFIVSGNGKFYSRSEIKIRIQKIARRIALKAL